MNGTLVHGQKASFKENYTKEDTQPPLRARRVSYSEERGKRKTIEKMKTQEARGEW